MLSRITRREFLGAAAAGSAALIGLPSMGWGLESRRAPNFVVLFIDDLGYQDVGCYGSTKIRTPRMDRLAADVDGHDVDALGPPAALTNRSLCPNLRGGLNRQPA